MIIFYSGRRAGLANYVEHTEIVPVMMSYTYAFGTHKDTLRRVHQIIRRRRRQKKQQ